MQGGKKSRISAEWFQESIEKYDRGFTAPTQTASMLNLCAMIYDQVFTAIAKDVMKRLQQEQAQQEQQVQPPMPMQLTNTLDKEKKKKSGCC